MNKDCWQTPEYILKAVREVLGDNYFDPCPINPQFDGLEVEWERNAFINPPYSRGSLEKWTKKGLDEFYCLKSYQGKPQQIWLINYGCTENRKELKVWSDAICDLYQRVAFINPATGEAQKGNDRDSVIYYIGDRQKDFIHAFKHLGEVFTK